MTACSAAILAWEIVAVALAWSVLVVSACWIGFRYFVKGACDE